MVKLRTWIFIIGVFLLIAVATAACGLVVAKILIHFLRCRSKALSIIIESNAFAIGSILSGYLIFYIFCAMDKGAGYPGVVGALILLIAAFQSLINFGFVLKSTLKPSKRPSWKWKMLALLTCVSFAMIAIEYLK